MRSDAAFILSDGPAVIESGMVTLTNIDPIKNMHRFYGVQIVRTLSANGPLCAGGAASDHPAA